MGDPLALWQLLWRRGERSAAITIPDRPPQRRMQQMELDVSHLFTGHDIRHGSKIALVAGNQAPERSISFTVSELSAKDRMELLGSEEDGSLSSRLVLQIKGHPTPPI